MGSDEEFVHRCRELRQQGRSQGVGRRIGPGGNEAPCRQHENLDFPPVGVRKPVFRHPVALVDLPLESAVGLWVVVRGDEDYPARLKQRPRGDAPPVLFGCGDRRLLDRGGIAVVGARDAAAGASYRVPNVADPESEAAAAAGGHLSFYEIFVRRLDAVTAHGPATVDELLRQMDVNRVQVQAWLGRAVAKGRASKLKTRPVRYRSARDAGHPRMI